MNVLLEIFGTALLVIALVGVSIAFGWWLRGMYEDDQP
jgi:hypothetical protein